MVKYHLLTDVSRKRNAVWVNLFSVQGVLCENIWLEDMSGATSRDVL